jgi:hypothetical protein
MGEVGGASRAVQHSLAAYERVLARLAERIKPLLELSRIKAMSEKPILNDLDGATRQRLALLAGTPVDTTGMECRLRAAMDGASVAPAEPAPTVESTEAPRLAVTPEALAHRQPRSWWWRPVSGLAAAIILMVGIIGFTLLCTSPSPVIAAPPDLVRLHQSMGAHASGAVQVSSIDHANRVIADEWSQAPAVPAVVGEQVKACCLHDLKDRKVVCVVLHDNGKPRIMMVVARSRDVRPAEGRVVERGGRKYVVHEMHDLTMVMTQSDGRYVCLMGELPVDRLLATAGRLRF